MQHRIVAIYEAITATVAAAWAPLLIVAVVLLLFPGP